MLYHLLFLAFASTLIINRNFINFLTEKQELHSRCTSLLTFRTLDRTHGKHDNTMKSKNNKEARTGTRTRTTGGRRNRKKGKKEEKPFCEEQW